MKKKRVKKLAKKLSKNSDVVFVYKDIVYVIQYSPDNSGWMIDLIDPYDIESSPYDGGLCTGSTKDAIEFMLPHKT